MSQISTQWTMILRAHDTPADVARTARHELLERYGGAVQRYLLGALHNEESAIELCQEFAVRFLRGDFHNADPARGRFRDYLKTALIHLVGEYRRARGPTMQPLGVNTPAAPIDNPDDEAVFLAGWRAELLDRTWDALAAEHPIDHAALHWRVEQPDLNSAAIAERMAQQFAKPFTAAAVRKAIQRAHARYAQVLIAEVERTLGEPTPADVERELRELDLLRYCRSTLAERDRSVD